MTTLVVLAVLTTCISFFCEAIFGFGGGLISIPILSLLVGVHDGVTYILIFQLLMGLLILQSYRDIQWRLAIPMSIGIVIGALAGTFLLASLSDEFLRRFLAIAIVAFLIKMIFLPRLDFGKLKSSYWGALAGAIGGWFQGVIGTGGPVFTMYLSAVIEQKAALRATLIYLFFSTSVVRIAFSIPAGLINQRIVSLALITLPFFLVAIILGSKLQKRIPEQYYRYAIYVILSLAAVSMLVKR